MFRDHKRFIYRRTVSQCVFITAHKAQIQTQKMLALGRNHFMRLIPLPFRTIFNNESTFFRSLKLLSSNLRSVRIHVWLRIFQPFVRYIQTNYEKKWMRRQSSLDYDYHVISSSINGNASFAATINGGNECGQSYTYICLVLISYTPIDV